MVRIVRSCLENPLVTLTLLLIPTTFFTLKLFDLQLNTSQDAMFNSDDPEMIYYRDFVEDFGSDEALFVFFEHPDLFSLDVLKMVQRMTERFKEIAHVEQVISLTNYNLVYNEEDILTVAAIEDVLDSLQRDDIQIVKERVISDPLSYKIPVINKNGRGAGFGLYLEKRFDPTYRKEIVQRVREIVAEEEGRMGIHFYIGGSPFGQVAMDEIYRRDMELMSPLMIGMVMFVLLLVFRRPLFAWLPLLIIMVSCIWTFGFIAAMGWYMTPITEIALPLLLVYCVLASMHFLNAYRNNVRRMDSRRVAVLDTVEKLWKPSLYASVTTAMGFLSLTASSVEMIKDLGLYCGFGILVSFVMTFLILPLCLERLPLSQFAFQLVDTSFIVNLLSTVKNVMVHHRKAVLLGAFGIMAFFAYWVSLVTVDTDSMKLFKEDAEVVRNEAAGRRIFGPWAPIEFSVESIRGERFTDPFLLGEMEKLQRYLEKDVAQVDKSISIVDFLKKAHQELYGGDKRHAIIPEKSSEVERLLGFVEFAGGERGVQNYLRKDLRRARITARAEVLSAWQNKALFDQIEGYVTDHISPNLKIRMTGDFWLGQILLNRILFTEIQSFSIAFLLICLCFFGVFRSLAVGLIAIPVNLFPVVIILGTMGKLNINLDVGTCTVASIVIAMAVDDTIHFLHRFREEIREHENYGVAIQQTMEKVGPPIVYTSLVLAAGFWVLIFSSYVPALNFGFLSGVAVLAALIGDILILPALLLWFKPIRGLKPMWEMPAVSESSGPAEAADSRGKEDPQAVEKTGFSLPRKGQKG